MNLFGLNFVFSEIAWGFIPTYTHLIKSSFVFIDYYDWDGKTANYYICPKPEKLDQSSVKLVIHVFDRGYIQLSVLVSNCYRLTKPGYVFDNQPMAYIQDESSILDIPPDGITRLEVKPAIDARSLPWLKGGWNETMVRQQYIYVPYRVDSTGNPWLPSRNRDGSYAVSVNGAAGIAIINQSDLNAFISVNGYSYLRSESQPTDIRFNKTHSNSFLIGGPQLQQDKPFALVSFTEGDCKLIANGKTSIYPLGYSADAVSKTIRDEKWKYWQKGWNIRNNEHDGPPVINRIEELDVTFENMEGALDISDSGIEWNETDGVYGFFEQRQFDRRRGLLLDRKIWVQKEGPNGPEKVQHVIEGHYYYELETSNERTEVQLEVKNSNGDVVEIIPNVLPGWSFSCSVLPCVLEPLKRSYPIGSTIKEEVKTYADVTWSGRHYYYNHGTKLGTTYDEITDTRKNVIPSTMSIWKTKGNNWGAQVEIEYAEYSTAQVKVVEKGWNMYQEPGGVPYKRYNDEMVLTPTYSNERTVKNLFVYNSQGALIDSIFDVGQYSFSCGDDECECCLSLIPIATSINTKLSQLIA